MGVKETVMKNLLFTLVLAVCPSVAFASLPYTDMNYRPNPLNKPVDVVVNGKSFAACIDLVEEQAGIRVNIDRKGFRKAGISEKQGIQIARVNCAAMDMVLDLIEQIDPEGKLAVYYEEDGSLTIGLDE
jgi:hypothetical protein